MYKSSVGIIIISLIRGYVDTTDSLNTLMLTVDTAVSLYSPDSLSSLYSHAQ